MVHIPLMFLSEWREFPSAPCLALQEKNLMTARVSMLLKSRVAWHASFHPLLQEKTCNSAHEQILLSNDTINSVLRHRELGRANDLSEPPRSGKFVIWNVCWTPFVTGVSRWRLEFPPLLVHMVFCIEQLTSWDMFFSKYFGFPLSLSFCQCYVLVFIFVLFLLLWDILLRNWRWMLCNIA